MSLDGLLIAFRFLFFFPPLDAALMEASKKKKKWLSFFFVVALNHSFTAFFFFCFRYKRNSLFFVRKSLKESVGEWENSGNFFAIHK